MRVLFFNEGNIGSHILGQSQLGAALRAGMSVAPDIDARFTGLPPLGRVGKALASRRIEPLAARNLDLRTLRYHAVQSARARVALRRELREFDPAVLHLHTQSIAMFSLRLMRAQPTVLSVDSSVRDWARMPAWAAERGASWQTAPSALLERRVLAAATLVTAWTDWARRGVEAEQPRANVIEHHPGLDLERWRPAPRSPRARPRVLFVGGRFAEKGGEDLLAALGERLGADVELDLVTPIELAPREGVRTHRLLPDDPALVALYQQADLLCLPTHGDTNPWVLLEAMACETPVISTPVGAIPEMLDHGRAGTVVPYGDVRALRAALDALLDSPERRSELGRAGRVHCELRYDARRQFSLLAERMRAL